MTAASQLIALKWGAVAVAGAGAFVLTLMAARDPESVPNVLLERYVSYLRARSRSLFLTIDARFVVLCQALFFYGFAAVSVAFHEPAFLLGIAAVGALPALWLERARRRRVAAIEEQTDAFIVALASALRATPSIGDAFGSLHAVLGEPLKSEIGLALKEMRLGATLDMALRSMAARIQSRAFDTALAAVLVGQRVGGNLPTVLAATGAAIRELHRLDRATKAKTASGRMQMTIIAFAPFVLAVVMNRMVPGYFTPLTTTYWGMVALGASIGLWVGALALGRRILRVVI